MHEVDHGTPSSISEMMWQPSRAISTPKRDLHDDAVQKGSQSDRLHHEMPIPYVVV
jgi:hypothetical protein